MISQEEIMLPDGSRIIKKDFIRHFSRKAKKLDKYRPNFYSDPKILNEAKSTSDLGPIYAAHILHYVYEIWSSKEDYEQNRAIINQVFADKYPNIKTLLEELDEKINQLEETAKNAPQKILEKWNLEYLFQPVSKGFDWDSYFKYTKNLNWN